MSLAGGAWLEAGLAGSAAAVIVTAVISGIVAWSGPVDRPRERGSHKAPTPTAGGLGIIAGGAVGLLVFITLAPQPVTGLGRIAAALGFASALGLLGALDDLVDLGARAKFLAQIALSLLFAVLVARIEAIPITMAQSLPLGPIIGVIGTALWLVVVVNAVNFMDGSNGLAAGGVAIALVAFAAAAFLSDAPVLGGAAITAAFAGIGFMPWNFPKARLFQGDAGALFSGFFLAALAVIGARKGGATPVFVLFAPLVLLPFLTDVLLTLWARARAKKRLFDAHSEHLYQRWLARRGRSHPALAWRMFAIIGAFALVAVASCSAGPALQLLAFLFAAVVSVLGWTLISRRNGCMER